MLVVRKQFRPALNPFTMSFLDTVSAGFGAAFFLFIIFASLPIEKSSGMLGSEEYIQIELEWNSLDYNLELIVDPPGSSRTHQRLFLHNNAIIENPITGEIADLSGRESWQTAFINGASAYGQSTSTILKSENSSIDNKQHLSFRANGTCPEDWKFFVAVKSNKDYLSRPDFQPFTVVGRAFTSRVNSEDTQYKARVDLLEGSYLPQEYGSSRGAALIWYDGPDKVTSSEYIKIEENKRESMGYCG
ncbi:MAG: hypothetical protein G8D90_14400 [gamma proteobacterium symbiont of Clathrolucina costata]